MGVRLSARAAIAVAALAVAAPVTSAAAAPAKPGPPVNVQVLALNDFHGNLKPPSGSSGRVPVRNPDGTTGTVDAGGAEFLATHLKTLEAANPNRTEIVAAGDLIGASPLISALFHDEPTIESLGAAGLDLASVGNHEFDEGKDELLRMQNGGCHPVDGCQDGDGFAGAAFKYLSANVVDDVTQKPLFPAYAIKTYRGEKVAYIGLTLKETPTIVTPSGVAGLAFLDEVVTTNALVDRLARKNAVEAFVILLHQGGQQNGTQFINECNNLTGPIIDLATRFDDRVDVVISGHTHQAYNCVIDGKVVTSASSFGRVITKVDLGINPLTGDIDTASATNLIVTRTLTPDSTQTALIQKYDAKSAPFANRVIGTIGGDLLRANDDSLESVLGNVIADSQLNSTAPAGFGDAVIAFMNPGGIRTDILYNQISGGEAAGEVTYGEAFNVQPFGNSLVTITLTGAQIERVLEQQFNNPTPGAFRVLSVSQGFAYTWRATPSADPAPAGGFVDPATIALNGTPIDPAASYRVTVNNFLVDGGDNFSVFAEGTNRLGGDVDLDALEKWLTANPGLTPPAQDRITKS